MKNGVGINIELWKIKRRNTFVSFCVLACCLGTEYSIIIPSLWFYLTDVIKVKEAKTFYGVILAVYYISAIIGSFTITWIADRTRRIRLIMLILIMCEVIGNILYSVPTSPYFPLIGRFIQGLGDINMSIITAEIARSFQTQDICPKISTIVTCFSITFVIAPAMNVAFKYIDINVLGWQINYGNLPGLFMAVCFICVLITTYFFVSDLSKEYDLKEMKAKPLNNEVEATTELTHTLHDSSPEYNIKSKRDKTSDERRHLIIGSWINNSFVVDQHSSGQFLIEINKQPRNNYTEEYDEERATTSSFISEVDDKRNSCKIYTGKQLLRNFDFVFLVTLGFLMSFSVVGFLDVAMPIYANKYYYFSSRDTGILFFVTGVLFIFVVNVTKRLSGRISEYCFLVIGFAIFITSTSFLCAVTFIKDSNYYLGVALFVGYVLLLGVCWCIEQVFIRSLLTKIIPSSSQAFAEGIRRSISSFACIIASLCVPYILNNLSFLCIGVILLSLLSIATLHLRRSTLKESEVNAL